MAKMTKAERIYAAQQAYDDMILEAKIQAQAEQNALDAQPARQERPIDKTSKQLLQEWEEVIKGTHNWNAMENWLHKQSAAVAKRAQIKQELSDEINKNMANTRTYEREGALRGDLTKIGELPVYHTVWDCYPEGPTPWGTLWYHQKDRESEKELNIMSNDGWVNGFDVLDGNDPKCDETITYEDIKKALEKYEGA